VTPGRVWRSVGVVGDDVESDAGLVGVGDEVAVDDVGDAPFQRPDGFLACFAFGDLAVVVDAAWGVVTELVTAAMWMAWLSLRFPLVLRRCLVLPADDTSIGAVALYVA
jgi:hypothetical protein